ncbi:MAG TPA: S8 family peptidase [Gaiellaceae bacterium]|nr:S8 family peptidase [Gaiellaceae bacterium]
MKRQFFGRGLLMAIVAIGVGLTAGIAGGATGPSSAEKAVYIVRLAESPVVAYDGGIAGYKATRPAKGKKIDPNSTDVARYARYLDGRHDTVLAKSGGQKVYDYRYTFNGFAARMTKADAARAEADPGVLSVEKTQEVTMDTATTPDFLGLTKPAAQGGLWAKGIKGENVVIGVLDSGIWPESKSFTDRDADGKLIYQPNPGNWHGRKCHPGEAWTASMCNQKLIGAQFYCESRGCDGVLEHEFLSPRDYNGHGTHTASTAGGNQGVPTTGGAALFGTVNGIAPRARIAAYKVCWDNGAGGCGANTGDAVAAIDQAVADGVDVINYSISGTRTNYLDSVEVAYLFAADAGVFVATSAGNSGPTATTVAHISPWLASVAAGTHNRNGVSSVTLGNGATYNGASLTPGVASSPFVHATAVGLAGADPNLVRQCFSASGNGGNAVLDPAKVAGKVVLCERGGAAPANARVDKSAAVREAGGVGVVIANVAANSLNADLHSLPTVHVDHTAFPALAAYAATEGATASLAQATVVLNAPAPDVAAFSSRGPSLAGGGDVLKPDFMLPGVDILAAISPMGSGGKDFDIASGTSMSSPHVAGAAALLTQAHPNWSPAAMRSAMATTADAASRSGLANPLNVGSGHVQPNLMIDPGLVYDAGFADYLAFLKGQRLCCASSASIPARDASDLNQPSLAVGDLAGTQTLTRRVTNVGGSTATYTATVVAPAGYTVSTPAPLTLAPGETKAFSITVTRTDAPFNAPANSGFRFGSLTWSDGTHTVRSPIVIRPVPIAAPAELTLAGQSGATSFAIKTGYNGALAYDKRGLIPSQVFSGTVADDPRSNFNQGNPTANQGIVTHDIVVPADTSVWRISMFDADTDGAHDIDLYLYRIDPDGADPGTDPDLVLVGLSGGGTSTEQIQLANPTAATYRLFVHGWETDGPDANYSLHSWALGTSDAGNMTVSGPATATIGGTGTVNLSWTGLEAGKRYFGQLRYNEGATTHGSTIVRVDG